MATSDRAPPAAMILPQAHDEVKVHQLPKVRSHCVSNMCSVAHELQAPGVKQRSTRNYFEGHDPVRTFTALYGKAYDSKTSRPSEARCLTTLTAMKPLANRSAHQRVAVDKHLGL